MRSYAELKRILELWEQGYPKKRISIMTGIPRGTVIDCIKRYGSVERFEKIATGILPDTYDSNASEPVAKRYIIPGYKSGKRRWTDEQLKVAVAASFSIAQVLREFGLRPAGSNYEYVKRRIKELGLDTSHFTGSNWLKGKPHPAVRARSMEEILVKNSVYTSTNSLRKRLIAEGYFEPRCASCHLTEWLDQPIPLEVDHINGDRHDNRLENLRLLCPNCHALTATYRGKNKNGQRG